MFYLIGLGTDLQSIGLEALEACKKCNTIYLEDYTSKFPYPFNDLEKLLKKKITSLNREEAEKESFLHDATKQDIALLVYGSPLAATTHITLLLTCRKESIPYKVFHNAGILETVAETGLQLYKFGKTASMPKWTSSFHFSSCINIIKENQKINAHTILLIDIGLSFKEALLQLMKGANDANLKIDKIIICSQLGTKNQKILYTRMESLQQLEVEEPFCIIIPGKLHFLEEESLASFLL